MEEKKGDPNCKHEWIYDDKVICTMPATTHKICRKCGRVEHEQDVITSEAITFDSVWKEFHRKTQSSRERAGK